MAAIRTLPRLECVLEAMPWALNQLSDVAPAWVQPHAPPDWYPRCGLRSGQARPPKEAGEREALARQAGADGDQRLAWGRTADMAFALRALPAVAALRQMWLPPYDRCTAPGFEALRWRTGGERPPAAVRITSPYDPEARYRGKRDAHGVGYKVHLTGTCDADQPALMTQVPTTPATTQDGVTGPTIRPDPAQRDLRPGTHVLDSGYVAADLLVTAQTQHHLDVAGPAFGS